MEDECVGMYYILFYLSFVKRGEFIQAEVDPLLFLWKVQKWIFNQRIICSFLYSNWKWFYVKRSTLVWLEVSVLGSGPIGAFRVAERLDTSAVF